MNDQFNGQGAVHTASYIARGFDYNAHTRRRPVTTYGCILDSNIRVKPSRQPGGVDTLFKFNPNKMTGSCNGMAQYRITLDTVTRMAGITVAPQLVRLDFKLDCAEDDYRHWVKSMEMLAYCFMVAKKVKIRDRGRTTDPFTGKQMSTLARTKGFEIVVYNKREQKPEDGIAYRVEFRRKNIAANCDERKALQQWQSIINGLPKHYDAAMEALADKIALQWGDVRKASGSCLNQHILTNIDFLFGRDELKCIFQKLGASNPENATRNYINRYKPDFISKAEFYILCKAVSQELQRFIDA